MGELASAFVPISFSGLEKFQSDLSAIRGQLESKLGAGLMKGLGMLGIVAGIGTTVAMAVKKAMDAESKLHEMKDTLAATGQAVDGNIAKFKELAASIAQTTTVSKGHVMGLIQQGLQLGLSADQAQRFSTVALGLGKRLGIDSAEAMELLARGDDRAMMALGRHSREIASATTKQGKLDAINRVAAQGMEMLGGELNTSAGKWEHLQQQVGSLYGKFGQMLLPIISSVIDALSNFFDWIMQLVGAVENFGSTCEVFNTAGSFVSGFGDTFTAMATTIKEYVEGIIFAFNNWDLVIQRVGVVMAMTVVGMGDRISWFAQQIPIALVWIWNNFFDIFTTIGSFVKSVFTGLVTNIKGLWTALLSWFHGTGFNFNWSPLMKDFQSTIKNAPAFTKFVNSDLYNGLSKQLDGIDKETDKRAQRWQGALEKAKPNKEKAKGVVASNLNIASTDMNKTSKGTGSFTGLADAWKKAQEGILKNGEERKAAQERKKQTNLQERTAKATEKIAASKTYAVAH